MTSENIIKAYTLKNALEHNGKAIVGAVVNSLFTEGLKKEDVKKIIPSVQNIVNEINSLDLETQKKEFAKIEHLISHRETREGLPDLPNAKKGKVVTRFAPSPSGPLHIGHALSLLPNFLYTQKYKGKFYIRIEDTNPENIYPPAYKMIKEESKWLCKNKVKFIIQSERMNLYYKYIEKLIDKNAVYVCTCDSEKFKSLILNSNSCPCRNLPKKEQLKRWKRMLDKKGYAQGEAVLRFKSNLQDKNPAMRDFPLARINLTKHPLQKNKYKVWPLMNLAVTVDDIEQDVTHVIRGKDHKDNAERQKMIYLALNKEKNYPWIAFIGRLHLKELNLSASEIRKDIEKGKYTGWDDPRLPTLCSLKKQGYKPEAFWKYAEDRGISEADKTISQKDFYELLSSYNKQVQSK
ncbi:MAG: glutamate--tRNA ligase family protein [Nanoarchaeota archaeon]